MQKKTKEKDGYDAVQLAFGSIKEKNVNKPVKGHYKKASVVPMRMLREFKFADSAAFEVGKSVTCDIFAEGDKVDVTGYTKGKGFSGTIKRWNFHTGPMAHGSGYHRGVGSMGACSTPSRVIKNKKMPGQYGNEKVTVQNLTVVKVDAERSLLLVKGAIPGAKGGYVIVKQAVKG